MIARCNACVLFRKTAFKKFVLTYMVLFSKTFKSFLLILPGKLHFFICNVLSYIWRKESLKYATFRRAFRSTWYLAATPNAEKKNLSLSYTVMPRVLNLSFSCPQENDQVTIIFIASINHYHDSGKTIIDEYGLFTHFAFESPINKGNLNRR